MYFLYELLIQLISKNNSALKLSKPAHMHSSMHIFKAVHLHNIHTSVRA